MAGQMGLTLSQKQTQTLRMTPDMKLSIKILQLNSIELKNQISEVLETNPVVELDESKPASNEISLERVSEAPAEPVPPSKEFKEESRGDYGIDWQKYIEDSERSELKVSAGARSFDEETSFESFVSKKTSLREHLSTQLSETNLTQTESRIGEYLIGLIDKNGYIRLTNEQIASSLKISAALVKRVRVAIETFDPTGVGAYDLRECLLIQAREEGYNNDAVTAIINNHLEDLARNRINNIIKSTGCDADEVSAAIETIKSFNPKPGASFASSDNEIYISPEVFVEKVKDEYVVSINERDVPRLRISEMYKSAIKNKAYTEKETYEFIRGKLDAARTFLKFVDRRKETILKVARAIFEVQKDFLEHGILHLRPLTLQDAASMTGLHESTVSRAVNGKYVQTPLGLFELKFFFSGGAAGRSGDDISTVSVKQKISELIKGEDPKRPLSDSQIVEILKKDGIALARRTVAKYRVELNIQSSSVRKQR